MSTKTQSAIGGYFSLELPTHKEYHHRAVKLNSGKNAFEYVLRSRYIRKIYIPLYTCRVIILPIKLLGIDYEYYHINKQLEIADKIHLSDDEVLLYTNYFGIKDDYVRKLATDYGNRLIVDNAQAFYSEPIQEIDTFYSCRKFFGVVDGGYAYTNNTPNLHLSKDISYSRMTYLLKRIDLSAEEAFSDYKRDSKLGGLPLQNMSQLTQRMMCAIDYACVAAKRKANYTVLKENLDETNLLDTSLCEKSVPLVYPYLTTDKHLMQRLISERIYVATYWPHIPDMCNSDTVEYRLTQYLIPLPIDQRYNKKDMERIIKIINEFNNGK